VAFTAFTGLHFLHPLVGLRPQGASAGVIVDSSRKSTLKQRRHVGGAVAPSALMRRLAAYPR
jgi:hypothetical protein